MSEKKQINIFTLFENTIIIILDGLWCGYFLKFYLEINKELMKKMITHFLLIQIISSFVNLSFDVLGGIVNFLNLGKILTKTEYENSKVLNNLILKIIYEINKLLSVIICCAFVPIFIPFTQENCHSYSNSICVFARIMAVSGVILMIAFGIVILSLIFSLISCLCEKEKESEEPIKSENVMSKFTEIKHFYKLSNTNLNSEKNIENLDAPLSVSSLPSSNEV